MLGHSALIALPLALTIALPPAAQTGMASTPGHSLRSGPALGGVGCEPPLPLPGETVVWTALDSPVEICSPATIPAGATVKVAPNTDVIVHAGVDLTVEGELLANGSPSGRVSFSGGGRIRIQNRSEVREALVDVDFDIGPRASAIFRDTTITDGDYIGTFRRDALVFLERSTILSGQPFVFGTFALRDVQIPSTGVDLDGFFLADGVDIGGGPLVVNVDFQPRRLSDVDVTNPGASPAVSTNAGGITPGSNLLIDADCDLSGGSVPVQLRVGGLHPESVVPSSGNARNAIELGLGAGSGACDWPNLGVPYYAASDPNVSGRLRVGGGATFEFESAVGLEVRGSFFDDTGVFRGRPEAPLLLRSATRGVEHAGVALFNARVEHVICDGGRLSSISGFNEILECTVRNASLGIYGDDAGLGTVRGCRILDNQTGAADDLTSFVTLDMNAYDRPNVFSGNELAARNNASQTGGLGPFPAEGNWWGDPTGPLSPSTNPSGQGDPVGFGVDVLPWLTSQPDLTNTPPFVDVRWPFILAEPGDTIFVTWDADDDGQIVSQRVRMDVSGGGNFQWVTIEDDLDAARRSAFVQVPFIGQTQDARSTLLQVEATDDTGLVGHHAITLQVPVLNRPDGNAQFNMDLASGFVPGEEVPVCYDALGTASGSLTAYVVFDTEDNFLQRGTSGSAGIGACTFSDLRLGKVSTNRARFMLFADGPGNDNDWYFSQPFAVRPLADFPDAPPQVALLSPVDGERFAGGTTVPVSWSASDDEDLREFRIQTSLNGGRTWSTVVTVPGTETSYDWSLPPLDHTLDEVHVRVVAVDARFQSTADGDQAALAFDPGA